jgi:hypothetical protein
MLATAPDSAAGLLVRNFKNCIDGLADTQIAFRWAEYEYRRRSHFAMELLLAALTGSLIEFEEASIAQVVSDWSSSFETSPMLNQIWPHASEAFGSNAIGAVSSVPEQLFDSQRIPTSELRRLAPSNQALAAVDRHPSPSWPAPATGRSRSPLANRSLHPW